MQPSAMQASAMQRPTARWKKKIQSVWKQLLRRKNKESVKAVSGTCNQHFAQDAISFWLSELEFRIELRYCLQLYDEIQLKALLFVLIQT